MVNRGDLIRLPGEGRWVKVRMVDDSAPGLMLTVQDDGRARVVELDAEAAATVQLLTADGQGDSARVLAGLWAEWMGAAATTTNGSAMMASSLTPYPHQHQAVYREMLPQPVLRFLLGDEPGTGKTIMAGMYAREAQRLGMVNRCLVVCPAHIVTKWQADFERFFGGGLHRVDNAAVKSDAFANALAVGEGFWVVSLELASMNSAVLEALHPDNVGWDLVVFDEAHRLTPSAETHHRVGRTLASTPRVLLMTATPHRGSEYLFQSLLHLVDPVVFPQPADEDDLPRIKPGPMHFLRRMKEELYDNHGDPLFHPRHAYNVKVPLSAVEQPFYERALDLVDAYFAPEARTLGKMVYGKRAASSLFALSETLRRRHTNMGLLSEPEATRHPDYGDPDGDDPAAGEHAKVIHASSTAAKEEKREITELLTLIDRFLDDQTHTGPADVSKKWPEMVTRALESNGIAPGGDRQLVVFTEYADTADWLVRQFRHEGFTCQRYSGRDQHHTRDQVRADFMAGKFQVIVSTDAGNEGIDLQSAQVLVNWDIPWSLVTLEQRMGRIHRVGQFHAVHLFNLITTGTLEGDTYARLLDKLLTAASDLNGQMFDCLALVGEQFFDGKAQVPLGRLYEGGLPRAKAESAIEAITTEQLRQAAQTALEREKVSESSLEIEDAIRAVQDEYLEQINPHIVENYLRRLKGAQLIELRKSMTGVEGGLFNIAKHGGGSFGKHLQATDDDGSTLVATLGTLKMNAIKAGSAGADRAVDLSPATSAFRALVDQTVADLRPEIFRGGLLTDETTVGDYTLLVFEVPVTEGNRQQSWRLLIRVDEVSARDVRFDLLNNLTVAVDGAAGPLHPGIEHDATAAALTAATKRKDERAELLANWHARAVRQLKRLPDTLAGAATSSEERTKVRRRIEAATKERVATLEAAAALEVGTPTLIGWAQVQATRIPADPTEQDSEKISMRFVADRLSSEGWKVASVPTENRGWDMQARKGSMTRYIEVKGVWGAASSDGVRMTGNEFTQAGVLGDNYWLYVIDQCHDGTGQLAKVVRNPASEFADVYRDVPILKIAGSDLMAASDAPAT